MRYFALFLLLGVTSLRANLVTNGSFEQPNLAANVTSRTFDAGSAAIPGWLVTDFSPENVSILTSSFTDGNLTFLAESGDQSLNLTGDLSGEAAGVRQTIALTIGDSYELTFWIGNQDNSIAHYSLDSQADLIIDGITVGSYANRHSTHHGLNWKEFTYDFTATKSLTSIGFQNATLSFDHEIGLDHVDLEDTTPSSVAPEFGTLLLSGLPLCFWVFAAFFGRPEL